MLGRRIGYAEANTYFPQATLRDSLIYGLRHAPLNVAGLGRQATRGSSATKPLASGNLDVAVGDGWIDYESAGATSPEDLLPKLRDVLAIVDMENDVYRLGLRGRAARNGRGGSRGAHSGGPRRASARRSPKAGPSATSRCSTPTAT